MYNRIVYSRSKLSFKFKKMLKFVTFIVVVIIILVSHVQYNTYKSPTGYKFLDRVAKHFTKRHL